MHRVPGDHKFLVGGHKGDLHLGIGKGDDRVDSPGGIGLIIKGKTEVGEVLANPAAQTAVVLADSSGEEDSVDTVHLGDIGADVLDHLEGEHLEDKLGLGVSAVRELVHLPGVGSLLGNSEEAALLVDELVHLVGIEVLLLHDVEDGVGIDITAAGSHDKALERGKTHGSVDRLAVLNSGDGTAVADMAGHHPGVVRIEPDHLGTLVGHELVAGPVGAVTADVVLLVILVRQAVHVGVRRHGLVECGVESHHLGDVGQNLLASPDTEYVGRIVQGSEVTAELDLLHHVLVDDGASGEEICSLDYPVAYRLDVGERLEDPVLLVHQGVQHQLHSDCVVRMGKSLTTFSLPMGVCCSMPESSPIFSTIPLAIRS